jgi:thioredoxin-like negative regulator of GroEL
MDHLKLKRAQFDSVMHCGMPLLIYFYKEGDAASTLGMESIRQLDHLVAKDFGLYIVDVSEEPEISEAFDVNTVPQIVTMKNSKIYKRSENLLYTNQILDLLK